MKKTITILLTLITLQLFSQDTTQLTDSSRLTLNKVYGDVKAGVTGIAAALKAPAEHVYTVLIKQQVVKSVIWIVLFIISAILILNWFSAYKSTEKWGDYDEGEPSFLGVVRTIQFACGLIAFVFFVTHLDETVTGFINPEYGAIKDIFEFIKK